MTELGQDIEASSASGPSEAKICFVVDAENLTHICAGSPGAPTGGAEHRTLRMARALVSRGFPVELIVPVQPGISKQFRKDGITITPAIRPAHGIKFVRGLYPVTSVINAMRASKAGIYFTWSPGSVSNLVCLYCSTRRIPHVFMLRSTKDVSGFCEQELKRLHRKLYVRALHNATIILCQTEHQKALLQENYGRKGTLLRNICSLADGASADTPRDVVLWVGAMREAKRPEWFVELASRIPDHQFAMIGGPSGFAPELSERVKQQAAAVPNLQVLGQLTFEEVDKYFRRALIHVLTSSSEGFANVLLEAWRQGTPSVSTIDYDDIISRHGLGRYCNDMNELVSAVRELLADDEERIAMGKRAIDYVAEHHSEDKVADQLARLCMELLRR